MSDKQFPLQDKFLGALRDQQTQVSIYLANGIRLIGTIEAFDNYVIFLKGERRQFLYKHAIATIVPAHVVNYYRDETNGNAASDQKAAVKKRTITRKRVRELA